MAVEDDIRGTNKQYSERQSQLKKQIQELTASTKELREAQAAFSKDASQGAQQRVIDAQKQVAASKAGLESLKATTKQIGKALEQSLTYGEKTTSVINALSEKLADLQENLMPTGKNLIISDDTVKRLQTAVESAKELRDLSALIEITQGRAISTQFAANPKQGLSTRENLTVSKQIELLKLEKEFATTLSKLSTAQSKIGSSAFTAVSFNEIQSNLTKFLEMKKTVMVAGAYSDIVAQSNILMNLITTAKQFSAEQQSIHDQILSDTEAETQKKLDLEEVEKRRLEIMKQFEGVSQRYLQYEIPRLQKEQERKDAELPAMREYYTEQARLAEEAAAMKDLRNLRNVYYESTRTNRYGDDITTLFRFQVPNKNFKEAEEAAERVKHIVDQTTQATIHYGKIGAENADMISDAKARAYKTEMSLLKQQYEEEERMIQAKLEQVRKEEEEKQRLQEETAREQERAERKLQREREKNINKLNRTLTSFAGNLPLGGLLSAIAQLGPMFAVLAILVGLVLKFLLRWDQFVTDIQKSMGVTREEAELGANAMGRFAKEINQASVYAPQVAKAVGELSDGLSGANLLTPLNEGNMKMKELAAASTVLNDKFQLSGDEMATLTDLSTSMGTSLSGTTIMVERMAKGSFNVRSVFQSLAKLTPSLLSSFRGTNAQLIAMAANAKRLGVEMGDIIQSSMSLLDVEDAITKAFEAQVVTGKNIDIDRLMFLQLTGDYGQVLQEQEKILKNADYLNNRSPVFQEMIAGSIGLTTDQASQIALRSLLSDRLGLDEAKMREMQKRGEEVQNVFDAALKEGKISELEFEQLSEMSGKYDALTIQEKFSRALDNLALNISSYFPKLTDGVRYLADTLESLVKAIGGFGMGETGKMVMGGLGGLAVAGLGLALGGKMFKFARALMPGAALATGAAGSAAGGSVLGTAGAGAAGTGLFSRAYGASIAQYNTMGRLTSAGYRAGGLGGGMAGMMRAARIGLKPALKTGLIGAGLDFGLGLASGQSLSRAAGGAGFALAGGVIGGLAGGPIGGLIGSTLGGLIGDQFFANEDNAQARMADMQQGNAQMRDALARLNAQQAVSQNPATTIESKIDTTNNLLRELISKPTNVTVELDGEKVGKATMNYASEAMDRGRTIGNTYGQNRDTTAIRPR
jgi:hypothetical protein